MAEPIAEVDRSDQLKYYYRGHGRDRVKRAAASLKCYRGRRAKLYAYLLEHPCVDCGEPDPLVLQFDHVRGTKISSVSRLIASGTWERALEEIAKCVVRCANCHARKTAREAGWYSHMERG